MGKVGKSTAQRKADEAFEARLARDAETGTTVRVLRRFQVTLPFDLVSRLRIGEGDILRGYEVRGRIVLEPCNLVPRHKGRTPGAAGLDERIFAAIGAEVRAGYSSGVVPLPKVRRRLEDVPAPELDERLLELDRARRVQLSAANDPKRIEKDQAIDAGARGLLYYVHVPEEG